MQRKGSLTNRIPVLRAELKWSQQELANRVGVSRQTIASLEANKYNPSLMLAFEIAKQFDKNIYEVFDYKFMEGE
ncbi:Transcriptional regulator, Cro/CI family (plasmid) [Priestia megaterium]|uniref:helix-turn-helix transcriptional regulator n=1 Tax=Priestia megaterium TaxID=1404 RepID=UPI0015DC22A8|nr:helix-turn-helix transcriptional regulator [Priestia megaterium]QLK09295.1 Transcriptional regulator, Cro/CI family [Priestia megaterium]WJD83667.1 helix-turn-helix transcriptional regulator [Priestia megaterium]